MCLQINQYWTGLKCISYSVSQDKTTLKIIINCLNTNIVSYLETSGGQSYNLYLNIVHFSTPVLIRHLWQFKTVVFLHCCLICAVLLHESIYRYYRTDMLYSQICNTSFLHNLQMGPISYGVCPLQAFSGKCKVTLWPIGPTDKLQRKWTCE